MAERVGTALVPQLEAAGDSGVAVQGDKMTRSLLSRLHFLASRCGILSDGLGPRNRDWTALELHQLLLVVSQRAT